MSSSKGFPHFISSMIARVQVKFLLIYEFEEFSLLTVVFFSFFPSFKASALCSHRESKPMNRIGKFHNRMILSFPSVYTYTPKKINIKRFLIVEWIEWTFSINFFFLHQRFCRIKSKQHTRQIAGSLPVWQGLRLRWISFKPEKQTAENENILQEEKSEIHSEHEKKECLEHAQWI